MKKSREMRRFRELPLSRRLVLPVLIAALLVSVCLCVRAFGQYHALRAPYRAALEEASERLSTAAAERAEADPGSETNAALRRQATEEMIEEGKALIAELERRNAELDEAAREAEEKIKTSGEIEDYEYYRAIYDEYAEGRAYVEDLLAKD